MTTSPAVTSAALTQAELDDLAAHLHVRVEVLDNQAERTLDAAALGAGWATVFTLSVRVRNDSAAVLPAAGWTLHVPSVRRFLSVEGPLVLDHRTGDHHTLEPGEGFAPVPPGGELAFVLVGETFLLHPKELLPRWYLSAPGLRPTTIASTDDEDSSFVAPLGPDNFAASAGDRTLWATPGLRYDRNAERVPVDAEDLAQRVVPQALRTVRREGVLDLSGGLSLVSSPPEVGWSSRLWWVDRAATLGLELDNSGEAGGVPMQISVDAAALPAEIRRPEGYRLTIHRDGVEIKAADIAGAGHAVMTLFGLLPAPGEPLLVPCVRIDDAPRYGHRAFMLDIARNFQGPELLRALVDQLAAYKLTTLHLHLSDDEGWRLEIPGLPELTEVGARRGHTEDERDQLLTQLGSGPDGDATGSGYLTRAEYVDLVRYAAVRGVEVLPEIDMPGHSRASVMAMEARYHRLIAGGATDVEAREFRLMDPNDTSRILTVQLYGIHSTLNPALPSTAHFVNHVITQIAAMHAEAGAPLRKWHYGGDEVHNILLGSGYADRDDPLPDRGLIDRGAQDHPWTRSPLAREFVDAVGLPDVSYLPVVLAEEVDHALWRNNVMTMFAWQDGLESAESAREFDTPAVAEVWVPMSGGATDVLAQFQAKGFPTVLSAPDFLYFDAPYEAHPAERGTTWATRWQDERVVFSLAPDNPPQAAAVSVARFGHAYEAVGHEPLEPMYGLQACLWTEGFRTREQVEAAIFPRLLAVAERAWHRAPWEADYSPGTVYSGGTGEGIDADALRADFSGFVAVVGARELPKLDAAGVLYRVPPPGARRGADGLLRVNSTYPALTVRVSPDDGLTWLVATADEPLAVSGQALAQTLSADGTRTSRPVKIAAADL